MNKSIKIYVAILVFIFIVILIASPSRQKPIDWRSTYSVNDKVPFGLYVFDKEINGILKNTKIERVAAVTPYEFLEPKYNMDTLVLDYRIKGTFFNISESNTIDDQSIKEIFYF